ncbi:MAG TPA: FAD-dependent monooxygenase [Chitinophagaceae bacterium]|nr:FAD-dependent monooxygenase [Chitinophagaceae bacterium]
MEQIGTSIKTQVVIVGAGPTGLSLAAQLFRYGIDFIIIDKKPGTTTLSKALVVQARTLEIFQELGLAEKAIGEGRMTTALRVFYKGKTRADVDLKGLGTGLSPFAFALSLEQSKTEKLLADHLFANGKKVNWSTELSRFEQTINGVTVYCKNESGNEQILEAAYLVGCDGSGSQVRHQLGLTFEGTTEPKLFYVADTILQSPVINKDVLYMYMIKKGFVLFFPMEGVGHYRLVGILPDVKDMEQQFQFSDIEPGIKENIVSPVEFEKLSWFSTYKVHSRKAGAFMKGRCFIAGDAAHIHTPAGGQGMNTGIQDAYNLAWKLACVLRKEIKPEILNTYDTERSANAKRLLQTTDRMFDIMSGVNRFWNFMRLHFFSRLLKWITTSEFVRKRIFPLISQTGIAYPDSYLSIKSSIGKLKAGDRMHYFVFSDGKDIFSYLASPLFKLLYFGDDAGTDEPDFGNIILTRHSFHEIPEVLFGKETNFYILLRPDNHISYIGKDIGQCRELLNRISFR